MNFNLIDTAHHCKPNLNGCLNNDFIADIEPTPFPVQLPYSPTSPVQDYPSDMTDAHKLVQNDMKHLSLDEREQAYEDCHGVRQVVEENAELIYFRLNQMEEEISKIRFKSAYILAEQISKEFVHNKQFRRRFLRSSRFDAKVAACKIVAYFDMKLQLFGQQKLTKSITLSDLNEEDLLCLMSGKFQLLPHRDRSGRAIISFFGCKAFPTANVNSKLRSAWYFAMAALEDEETQRQGVVMIYYLIHEDRRKNKPNPSKLLFARRFSQFARCLPVRTSCAHFCYNGSTMMSCVATIVKSIQSYNRTRFRFHQGSDTECQFSLMGYGIPLHALPITCKHVLKTDNHINWIHRRRAKEYSIINGMQFHNGIDLPTKYDVLFGRGKTIQTHSGNERLRQMIRESLDEYEKAGDEKGEKSVLAIKLIKQIKELSGRFLKEDKMGWWIEVSDKVARLKVCAAFRTEKGFLECRQQRAINSTFLVDGNKRQRC